MNDRDTRTTRGQAASRDRRALLALAAALALGGTGCAFAKPTLAFKDFRATEVDFEGASLAITFALKNPNPIAINLASLSYALEVEGRPVVSGRPPDGMHVRANATTDLVFPTRVRFQDVVPVVATFLTKDSASYRASGAVGVRTPIGVIELPLSTQGTFPVPKVPQISFQPPRIQSLSFEGAKLVFPIQIVNRNPFPLPLGGISASISIGGARVGQVQAVTAPTLGASQSQVVELPLEVSFLQAGMAVANAIRSRSANVRLEGALRSGGSSLPIALQENLSFR